MEECFVLCVQNRSQIENLFDLALAAAMYYSLILPLVCVYVCVCACMYCMASSLVLCYFSIFCLVRRCFFSARNPIYVCTTNLPAIICFFSLYMFSHIHTPHEVEHFAYISFIFVFGIVVIVEIIAEWW